MAQATLSVSFGAIHLVSKCYVLCLCSCKFMFHALCTGSFHITRNFFHKQCLFQKRKDTLTTCQCLIQVVGKA